MKKLMMAAVALICMAMTCVVLTSCGSDDSEDVKTYTYTIGFTMSTFAYETSIEEYNTEAYKEKQIEWESSILNAYKTSLGVSSDTFTLTGTQTECDKKVVDACKKAEATVATIKRGTGTFKVINQTTNKTVYSYYVQ